MLLYADLQVPQNETNSIIPYDWEHFPLWKSVRQALYSCPDHFVTSTNIEGLLATDIFTLNTSLGATIEESVVKTLNGMRAVWDPLGNYQTYSFVRQTETFPDVILRETVNGSAILLGIELKGWYLLAKEEVPTFRFTVTESACNPWDLLVVVPWTLSNVLAGTPVLYKPFVQSSLFCAKRRNYYWIHERESVADRGEIIEPENVSPYPLKTDRISDKATEDSGSNFGRLARYGVMDEYLREVRDTLIRGIPAREWQTFFRSQMKDRN